MTERAAPVPAELQAAMRSALNDKPSPSAYDLREAAKRLLEKVLDSECESRSSALDLLTVDALVTQALEEAAKDPGMLEAFPEQAMQRLSQ